MAGEPAVVRINEYNGAGETRTTATNLNYGNTDGANLTLGSNDITKGENSFIKYWKLEYQEDKDSSQIEDISVWRTGNLGDGDDDHVVVFAASYATPVATDLAGSSVFPTAEPLGSAANVLGTALSTDGDLTGYVASQIQTDGADTEGAETTFWIHWVYFETQA